MNAFFAGDAIQRPAEASVLSRLQAWAHIYIPQDTGHSVLRTSYRTYTAASFVEGHESVKGKHGTTHAMRTKASRMMPCLSLQGSKTSARIVHKFYRTSSKPVNGWLLFDLINGLVVTPFSVRWSEPAALVRSHIHSYCEACIGVFCKWHHIRFSSRCASGRR